MNKKGKIWMVQCGHTFKDSRKRYGDFDQWTSQALGLTTDSVDELEVFSVCDGDELPDAIDSCQGIVITGAHEMISDHLDWSEGTAQWLKEMIAKDIPTLGICYGHQLIAYALGGRVSYCREGTELGTRPLTLNPAGLADTLLTGLPERFMIHTSHSETVSQLPLGAMSLAFNDHEPHHIVRYAPQVWGLQFHPEFNPDVMTTYIEHSKELSNTKKAKLMDAIEDTPMSASIMHRFMDICREREL